MDFTQAMEILANVAVLAGIVFLAFEVRQNNNQLRAQSRFNYFHTRIELSREAATNFNLSQITLKKASGDLLTPQESYHSKMWAVTIITAWRYEFGEYKQGNLTLPELDLANKRRTIGLPGWPIREVLAETPDSEFKRLVQEHIVGPYDKDPGAYKLNLQ